MLGLADAQVFHVEASLSEQLTPSVVRSEAYADA
jgi:hypothetical protein